MVIQVIALILTIILFIGVGVFLFRMIKEWNETDIIHRKEFLSKYGGYLISLGVTLFVWSIFLSRIV